MFDPLRIGIFIFDAFLPVMKSRMTKRYIQPMIGVDYIAMTHPMDLHHLHHCEERSDVTIQEGLETPEFNPLSMHFPSFHPSNSCQDLLSYLFSNRFNSLCLLRYSATRISSSILRHGDSPENRKMAFSVTCSADAKSRKWCSSKIASET